MSCYAAVGAGVDLFRGNWTVQAQVECKRDALYITVSFEPARNPDLESLGLDVAVNMWYETLPAFALIIGALTATGVGVQFVQKAFNGGKVMSSNYSARITSRLFLNHLNPIHHTTLHTTLHFSFLAAKSPLDLFVPITTPLITSTFFKATSLSLSTLQDAN